jgi:hypothetical protein
MLASAARRAVKIVDDRDIESLDIPPLLRA